MVPDQAQDGRRNQAGVERALQNHPDQPRLRHVDGRTVVGPELAGNRRRRSCSCCSPSNLTWPHPQPPSTPTSTAAVATVVVFPSPPPQHHQAPGPAPAPRSPPQPTPPVYSAPPLCSHLPHSINPPILPRPLTLPPSPPTQLRQPQPSAINPQGPFPGLSPPPRVAPPPITAVWRRLGRHGPHSTLPSTEDFPAAIPSAPYPSASNYPSAFPPLASYPASL